jgi:hypothetical protein
MYTYFSAETKLGNRQERKVGNNRWLRRSTAQYHIDPITGEASVVAEGLPAIDFVLHSTAVVTIILGDYYILRTGGWYTVTTKAAINEVIPAYLCSERGDWIVGFYEFEEGMVLNRHGEPVDFISPEEVA